MNRGDQIILVTGATGHQGGAAVRHLLGDGWRVRALVRDADKPAAQALAQAGVELIVGDLDDPASLRAATEGAYGVYSVQRPTSDEVTQGKNVADAAVSAGVKHLVYSSVIGADRASALPWVSGKIEIEHYLSTLDLPVTIWRPTTFMDNLLLRQRENILGGKLHGFEPEGTPHQWIAVDDIGRFIALAFLQPEVWIGRATEIAGDELTWAQAAVALSMALGIAVEYEQLPPAPGAPTRTPAADAPAPNRADIALLREAIPDLRTLADWAAETHAGGEW